MTDDELAALVLALVDEARATICPSDVARAAAVDWRPLMPRVRAVAAALADAGLVAVTQRGGPVDARTARGPIRLRRRR